MKNVIIRPFEHVAEDEDGFSYSVSFGMFKKKKKIVQIKYFPRGDSACEKWNLECLTAVFVSFWLLLLFLYNGI